MNSVEMDRIQAKLSLQETRGFWWFIEDLARKSHDVHIKKHVDKLLSEYSYIIAQNEQEGKLEQTKLF